MRQLLEQKNKAKAKKVANIEEIRAELRGTMGGRHKHLIDEDEEDVCMYPVDMTLDERAEFRVACHASKASEWNRQQEEGFMRDKRKMGKSLT